MKKTSTLFFSVALFLAGLLFVACPSQNEATPEVPPVTEDGSGDGQNPGGDNGGNTGGDGENTGGDGGNTDGGTEEPVITQKIQYYVSETGSDEADGKTAATAFASVQKAVNMAISDTAENQEKYTYVITVEGEITTSSSSSYGFVVIDSFKTLNFLIEAPEGQRATLKSDGSKRLFYIEGLNTSVTLRRLDIIDGVHYSGGGISLEAGVLTLDDVHLDNNESTDYHGGGVDVSSGNNTLIIKNSKFTSNVADDDGGAISIGENAKCTIDNSTFGGDNETLANSSKEGSAVYAYKANNLTISNSVFNNNIATDSTINTFATASVSMNSVSVSNVLSKEIFDSRGVSIRGASDIATSIDIENLTISGHNADNSNGGGLYLHNTSGTITGGKLLENTAFQNSDWSNLGKGGGAYISASILHITDLTISGNSAENIHADPFYEDTNGGGLYLANSTVTLENCIINENFSGGKDHHIGIHSEMFVGGGGGVFVDETSNLTISGGSFYKNSATYNGGALSVIGECSINNVTFGGETADFKNIALAGNGGAMYIFELENSSGIVDIQSSTISYNEAQKTDYHGGDGGGIFSAGNLSLNNVIIKNNKAVNGAGIFTGYKITDTGSTITNNIATEDGGGIYLDYYVFSDTIKLTATEISGNEASLGGGLYIYEEGLILDDVTVSNNKATSGAGVYIKIGEAKEFTVTSSTINKNIATSYGGGVFLADSGSFVVNNSIISENKAKEGAGICAPDIGSVSEPSVSIENSQVLKNEATASGGGIYLRDESSFSMISSEVSNNIAASYGGGIYFRNENYDFILSDGNTIAGNKAAKGGGFFGIVFVQGGIIENNQATEAGGGLYILSDRYAGPEISGGIIRNNYSSLGGGIYTSGKLNFSGNPVIWENYVAPDSSRRNNITYKKDLHYKEDCIYVSGLFTEGAIIGITPVFPFDSDMFIVEYYDHPIVADWDNVLEHIRPDDDTVYSFSINSEGKGIEATVL